MFFSERLCKVQKILCWIDLIQHEIILRLKQWPRAESCSRSVLDSSFLIINETKSRHDE